MSKLQTIQFTSAHLPYGTPSEEHPLTNPVKLLLCQHAADNTFTNPNFLLIHAHKNPFDEYQAPMFAMLTASSDDSVRPSADPLKKTFWMKTYSENKGILEQLEAQNILKRTGEKVNQGYVTLIGVETVLQRGQWSETCHGCGRLEQLDSVKPRMMRCGKCKDRYYCNKECQAAGWPAHKEDCKRICRVLAL
ncbi:hypothetical protein HYFRA_00010774 [Hymenoscyphus fraxineus]|uniref:MYND-type domain-containing protein n=1 Tax=Hymenoscyphus fraxineus TaxID=746836 RepID=A0A9N9L358_9HELO|nr:hypothetical protein HYFRA_00010774 [Hymenoscyphus fraxineus]